MNIRCLCAILIMPALAAAPLELSLKRAVQLAVSREGSARVQLSTEALKQAESRSAQARSALLPDLGAGLTVRNQTLNLAAFGFRFTSPIAGFNFPTFVGPFSTMDAR